MSSTASGWRVAMSRDSRATTTSPACGWPTVSVCRQIWSSSESAPPRVSSWILAAQKLPPSARKGDIWKRRFRKIIDWERYLTDQGYRIVKLFLNLSKEEQRRRFLDRIEEPEKNWKFSAADDKPFARVAAAAVIAHALI